MLKAKNIIIILVIQYVLGLILSSFIEIYTMNQKGQEVYNDVRAAADMALNQTQVIDSFIQNPSSAPDLLYMPSSSGGGFVPVNVFEGLYGLDPSNFTDSQTLFETLYNTPSFQALASQTGLISEPVQYYNNNSYNSAPQWYYVPTVAEMGMNLPALSNIANTLYNFVSTSEPSSQSGSYGQVSSGTAQAIFTQAGFNSFIHDSNSLSNANQTQYYFRTPLSLGITYLNSTFLGYLFENNMDLLMREKYNNTYSLLTPQGGNGVLLGSTYAGRITLGSSIDAQNPINNGEFTYLRGTANMNSNRDSSVQSYSGVTPVITYKVINMYDPANDTLLESLFGAYTGGYSTKAAYLASLDSNIINPVTGSPFNFKAIVVAKITFYADVVIPYSTFIIRDLRLAAGGSQNLADILPDANGLTGVDGSQRIEYSTLFAVTSKGAF